MLNRMILICFVGALFFFSGCNNVTSPELSQSLDPLFNGNTTERTILQITRETENFSILAEAILFAELDETLAGEQTLTVFTPTNDAFSSLLNQLELSEEEFFVESNKQLIHNILLYHITPGTYTADSLSATKKINTLLDKFAEVKKENDRLFIGNEENGFARITTNDVNASNGIIHIVDTVLQPPTEKANNNDDEEEEEDDDDSGNKNEDKKDDKSDDDGKKSDDGNDKDTGDDKKSEDENDEEEKGGENEPDKSDDEGKGDKSNDKDDGSGNKNEDKEDDKSDDNKKSDDEDDKDTDDDKKSEDENDKDLETIYKFAKSNKEFSLLEQAIKVTDLKKILDGKRKYTLFAPTNEAFKDLLTPTGLTTKEWLVKKNKKWITYLLLYHMASGNHTAEDITHSDKIRTLSASLLSVKGNENNLRVGNNTNGFVKVTVADIPASNGIIHVVEGVLVPPGFPLGHDDGKNGSDGDNDKDSDKDDDDDDDDEDEEDEDDDD